MPEQDSPLEIYEGGALTVIGFHGRKMLEGLTALDCRDQLTKIVQEFQCRTIAFDLTGLKLVPSGMLGLFASVKKSGIDVLLFNPTEDIREVLEITKLDTILLVFEADLD